MLFIHHAHHSRSSIIMCLQDCLRDPEKGLSQDEIFYSNGTARKKERRMSGVPRKPCAHVCLVWNIVCSPLCFCSKSMSSSMANVLFMHALCLIQMQRLSMRSWPWRPGCGPEDASSLGFFAPHRVALNAQS